MWAALGAVTLATVTAGLGVATPAVAGTLRVDVGIGLSLDGGLRLSAGASLGFDHNEWAGDNTGEQNPMTTVTGTTGAQTVWNRTDSAGRKITGKGVGVALIDSGIAPVKGLDGAGKVINGPDLSFESQAPNLRHLDTFGHGTHLAGIIAGQDSATFTGMAPDATLINLKAATADGATDVSQVIAAIDWVVTHRNDPGLNIRVLNLAFGTDSLQDPRLDPLSHAVEAAWRKGIVVVVAVGNDGPAADRVTMPAVNPYVLAVGASDGLATATKSDDVVASFSTRGNLMRHADLLAPGRSVVSLRNPMSYIDVNYPSGLVPGDAEQRFFRGSGTSQATAVVSGAAALLLQQRPNLTPDQVKMLLTGTATAMPAADPVGRGAGQLNVAAAASALTPVAMQLYPPSTGTGSLDKSRGTARVADPDTGAELTGERDIMGQAWNPTSWARASTAGTAWSGGVWNGRTWSGADWAGTSWAARTWSGAAWTGTNWAGRTWSSRTWTDAVWTGRTWSARTWSGRTWSGLTWSGRTWSGDRWTGSAWR
jgi:serine protease AprX